MLGLHIYKLVSFEKNRIYRTREFETGIHESLKFQFLTYSVCAQLVNPLVFGDISMISELMGLKIFVVLGLLMLLFKLRYGLLTCHIERLKMLVRTPLSLDLSLSHSSWIHGEGTNNHTVVLMTS